MLINEVFSMRMPYLVTGPEGVATPDAAPALLDSTPELAPGPVLTIMWSKNMERALDRVLVKRRRGVAANVTRQS